MSNIDGAVNTQDQQSWGSTRVRGKLLYILHVNYWSLELLKEMNSTVGLGTVVSECAHSTLSRGPLCKFESLPN